jgi:hypothetical protein
MTTGRSTDRVLAIERSGAETSVVRFARAMADVLDATVSTTSAGRDAVLDELERSATVLGVVARDHASSWRIATTTGKPVVLVPPADLSAPPPVVSRVLVPLDGTVESAGAVAGTMRLFASAGVEVVVLHVFDATTVPAFWDQAAHARRDWEHEFRSRFCPPAGVRLELRSGAAEEHVSQVAADARADLIALGWSQRLDGGRAGTVRGTVRAAEVPVMLVPLPRS